MSQRCCSADRDPTDQRQSIGIEDGAKEGYLVERMILRTPEGGLSKAFCCCEVEMEEWSGMMR